MAENKMESFDDIIVGASSGSTSSTSSVETDLNISVRYTLGASTIKVSNMDPAGRAPFKNLTLKVGPETVRVMRAVLEHQKANRVRK